MNTENFVNRVLNRVDEQILEAIRRGRRPGEISKNEVGIMGTRPASESPRGEMAKEYSRRKGTPVERYNAAKKSITHLSTQRETGRSPKVMKKTKKVQDAIHANIKSYTGKNWAGD